MFSKYLHGIAKFRFVTRFTNEMFSESYSFAGVNKEKNDFALNGNLIFRMNVHDIRSFVIDPNWFRFRHRESIRRRSSSYTHGFLLKTFERFRFSRLGAVLVWFIRVVPKRKLILWKPCRYVRRGELFWRYSGVFTISVIVRVRNAR